MRVQWLIEVVRYTMSAHTGMSLTYGVLLDMPEACRGMLYLKRGRNYGSLL